MKFRDLLFKQGALVLFLVLGVFSNLAVSQTIVSVYPDRSKSIGDTIHVPVHLTGNNILNMAFYLDYDHSLLTPYSTPYVSVHPDFEVTGYNPEWQPGTLGLFLDAVNLSGINFNGNSIITMVFALTQTGTTTMTFRNSTADMPVSGVWDELGMGIFPVSYVGNQIIIEPEVPPVRTVQNVTLHDGEINCFDATITITVAGYGTTFLVESGGQATFVAGSIIFFLPGATVSSGGYMHAYISPGGPFCGSLPPGIPAVAATISQPDQQSALDWILYPNPVKSYVILKPSDDRKIQGRILVNIYSIQGKLVQSESFEYLDNHQITLETLPDGIYLLRLQWADGQKILKVIKN